MGGKAGCDTVIVNIIIIEALRFIVRSVMQLIPSPGEKQTFNADRAETLFHKDYFTMW